MDDLSRRNSLSFKAKLLAYLPLRLRRRLQHRLLLGAWPRLRHPRFYSEVSTRELLNEEGVLAAIAGDKDACKTYARGLSPEVKTPRTRWVGRDPESIPEVALEGKWMVKLNAGSGAFARGEGVEDRKDLLEFVGSWTGDRSASLYGNRYYRSARQGFILEDYIDALGRPTEARFFCFGGRVEFAQIFSFVDDQRSDWYVDRHGAALDVTRRTRLGNAGTSCDFRHVIPADSFEEGRELAETLSQDFAHVRVDVYLCAEEVWFGELTPYPSSGFVRFHPTSFDMHLAQLWKAALNH